MRVLIAYDGSDCSETALRDLHRAGLPEEVEAQVFSVVEADVEAAFAPVGAVSGTMGWYAPPAFDEIPSPARRVEESRHAAGAVADRLRHEFPAWSVEIDVAYGAPGPQILDHLKSWKPDLLIMGSHGHSGFSHLILGNVSQHVLNNAHCPVRVARPPARTETGPIRLLIGIDASTDAAHALQMVATRHWPQGTEVRVIGVADGGIALEIHDESLNAAGRPKDVEEFRSWIAHATREAAAQLQAAGLKATHQVLSGDPAIVLTREAENWGADCIFLGARGVGTIHRMLLGSVSSEVAAHAHCSVEVIRPPAGH